MRVFVSRKREGRDMLAISIKSPVADWVYKEVCWRESLGSCSGGGKGMTHRGSVSETELSLVTGLLNFKPAPEEELLS